MHGIEVLYSGIFSTWTLIFSQSNFEKIYRLKHSSTNAILTIKRGVRSSEIYSSRYAANKFRSARTIRFRIIGPTWVTLLESVAKNISETRPTNMTRRSQARTREYQRLTNTRKIGSGSTRKMKWRRHNVPIPQRILILQR